MTPHERIARQVGLGDDEIARIAEGPDAAGWSPLEAALLRAPDELLTPAASSTPPGRGWPSTSTSGS
ncbi:MAG TPA: hypothetical protein VFV32_13735 [Acidimicrobiales bacterium]|nr:hypothetical protein [Acidimicrobiales bacterium]